LVSGTEYLTNIQVQLSGDLVATEPGDVVFAIPLHPKFFSGTRLLALARLYQKYRYKKLVVEFVPTVPSTQDGSFLMYFEYDVEANISVLGDGDLRLREAMSHLGSHMFNVYTYGRTSLVDDGQVDAYFLETGDDPRLEQQGSLVVMATSTFSPIDIDTAGDYKTMGNLIIHYEMELTERGLTNDPSTTLVGLIPLSTTATAIFPALNVGQPIQIRQSYLSLYLGRIVRVNEIVIFRVATSLTINGVLQTVSTESSGSVDLLQQGQIWYAYCEPTSPNGYVTLTDSLSNAYTRENDTFWNSNITAAWGCTGSLYCNVYDMAQ